MYLYFFLSQNLFPYRTSFTQQEIFNESLVHLQEAVEILSVEPGETKDDLLKDMEKLSGYMEDLDDDGVTADQ